MAARAMKAAAVHSMPLSSIVVGQRKRGLNPSSVLRLQESIGAVGLLNAITVTTSAVLVAGYHRLEACRVLGWTDIPVNVVQHSDLQREIAEIDENLIRNNLTQLEQSEQLQRRMDLYVAIHPTTKQGAAPGNKSGKGGKTKSAESASLVPSFAEDTAKKTGRSKRVIQEDIQIANDLDEETKEAVRGTPLENKKTDLLALAREKDVALRAELVEKVNSGASRSVKEAREEIAETFDALATLFDRVSKNATALKGSVERLRAELKKQKSSIGGIKAGLVRAEILRAKVVIDDCVSVINDVRD